MQRTLPYIALILTLLAGSTTATAGDFVPVPPPESFRGFAWGTPLDAAPTLLPVKARGYENTYYRTDEPLTMGGADIISVAYYFRKDKLYRVGVAFSGRANHFLLKEQLLESYGQGRGVGSRYGWVWPAFSIELSYDDEEDIGGLYYTYEGKLD